MWTLAAIQAVLPATMHGAGDVAIDGRALFVTGILCTTATLLFCLAPAWSLRRAGAAALLRGSSSSTVDPFWQRIRSALIVAELAIASSSSRAR